MRRALGVLCVVLVLGGWTSCQPTTGGEPMAGPTTTGLAALIQGEGWHYVGDTGEPAFENGWAEEPTSQRLAFRLRGTDEVQVQGAASTPSAAVLFTLSEGYRPTTDTSVTAITSNGTATLVTIHADGTVLPYYTSGGVLYLSFIFPIISPEVA